jgi:membrane protease YdiL (CAAX protease family)
LTGLGYFPNPVFVEETVMARVGIDAPQPVIILIYVFIASIIGLAAGSLTALGEEIGWRGFLVPELRRVTGFTGTSLISGLIWVVWHSPIILFADYNGETPVWYALICFAGMAVAVSFIMTWIRLKSGSLWTAMFFHASHNLFIQGIFNPLTMDTGLTEYIIGEFGIGLVIVYGLAAFYFWRRRAELPGVAERDGAYLGQARQSHA